MKSGGDRKDRHSKVLTAKGPRDRRVRLSAHTAIRFYDVQDRLGYDRPSKAVDWLIKKAKLAIDELTELPSYYPMANGTDPDDRMKEPTIGMEETNSGHLAPPPGNFFPTSSATASINFQGYPVDLISKTANSGEDFGLYLHNFHDSRGDGAYQRMMGVQWNGEREAEDPGLWQPLLGQSSASYSQRGPLQSNLAHSESSLGWNDSSVGLRKNQKTRLNQISSAFSARTLGFCMQSLNQGGGELGVVSGRQSSSPNSRH